MSQQLGSTQGETAISTLESGTPIPVATLIPTEDQTGFAEPTQERECQIPKATKLTAILLAYFSSSAPPLRWGHWVAFWATAVIIVALTGLVFGLIPFLLTIPIFLIGAFIIKLVDDRRKNDLNVSASAHTESTVPEFKKCLFCAEAIRYEAVLCRHCQKEQPSTVIPKAADAPTTQGDTSTQPDKQNEFSRVIQAICAAVVLVMLFGVWQGGFLGSSGINIFPSAINSAVPQIELDEGVKLNMKVFEDMGGSFAFSDWRWDQGVLKGKISLPTSARLPVRNSFWCTRYDQNGMKLDDATIHGPGSLLPGETAEVTVVFFDAGHRTAKIVVHSR